MIRRLRPLLALGLLAAPAAAQRIADLPRPQPAAPSPADGVALQAGDAIVTLFELNRFLAEQLRTQPNTTRAQDRELLNRAVHEVAVQELEVQAGEELKLDPRQVDLIVESQFQDQLREDGTSAFVDRLREAELDAFAKKDADREELMSVLYRRKVLGLPVADQRPTVDRYVRPGQLRATYLAKRHELAPTRVRYEVLLVSARAVGGPEQALAFCEEARERIEAGQPFAELVEEYGADLRDTGGVTPWLPLQGLPDQRLAALGEGPLGVLSSPMPIFGESGPDPGVGYQIARLLERDEPEPPGFDDPQVQRQLRVFVTNIQDQRRLTLAQEGLASSSYVWVNPLLQGVGPTATR